MAKGGLEVRRVRLPGRAEAGVAKDVHRGEKDETGRELVVKDHRVQSNGLQDIPN